MFLFCENLCKDLTSSPAHTFTVKTVELLMMIMFFLLFPFVHTFLVFSCFVFFRVNILKEMKNKFLACVHILVNEAERGTVETII